MPRHGTSEDRVNLLRSDTMSSDRTLVSRMTDLSVAESSSSHGSGKGQDGIPHFRTEIGSDQKGELDWVLEHAAGLSQKDREKCHTFLGILEAYHKVDRTPPEPPSEESMKIIRSRKRGYYIIHTYVYRDFPLNREGTHHEYCRKIIMLYAAGNMGRDLASPEASDIIEGCDKIEMFAFHLGQIFVAQHLHRKAEERQLKATVSSDTMSYLEHARWTLESRLRDVKEDVNKAWSHQKMTHKYHTTSAHCLTRVRDKCFKPSVKQWKKLDANRDAKNGIDWARLKRGISEATRTYAAIARDILVDEERDYMRTTVEDDTPFARKIPDYARFSACQYCYEKRVLAHHDHHEKHRQK